VRELARRVAALEARDREEALDDADRARLERARLRAARAARRAVLADALADRLHEARPAPERTDTLGLP
jgi:hypothetical protein